MILKLYPSYFFINKFKVFDNNFQMVFLIIEFLFNNIDVRGLYKIVRFEFQ